MTEIARKRAPARNPAPSVPARLHSLLVPVDLTPSSDRVLGRVSLLPLAHAARVTLLHVVPGGLTAKEERTARRDVTQALAGEARHLRTSLPRGIRVESVVRVGTAAKEISASATKVKAELIVMGRCRARGLRDAFLGSTAERVIRRARRPVLVARLAPRAAYGRPALALDFDRAAHDVVRLMLLVLPTPRPRVTLIHAFDDPYRSLSYSSLSDEEIAEREEEFRDEAVHRLTTLLARAKVPEDVPPLSSHVRYGSPRFVVERAVKRLDADLLVLGTQGHSGAAHAFLGTVAGDLMRAVKCDVLVVPPVRSPG